MKLKSSKKIVMASLSGLLLFGAVSPATSAFAAEKNYSHVEQDSKILDQLKKEMNSEQTKNMSDVEKSQYLVNIVNNKIQPKSSGNTIRPMGKVGTALKGIAFIFRNGGWVLAQLIRPLSPKVAAYIRKHSARIGTALDKVDKVTYTGIYDSLRNAGVPRDVASSLANFIVTYLL